MTPPHTCSGDNGVSFVRKPLSAHFIREHPLMRRLLGLVVPGIVLGVVVILRILFLLLLCFGELVENHVPQAILVLIVECNLGLTRGVCYPGWVLPNIVTIHGFDTGAGDEETVGWFTDPDIAALALAPSTSGEDIIAGERHVACSN
jgi:hypothetical protein